MPQHNKGHETNHSVPHKWWKKKKACFQKQEQEKDVHSHHVYSIWDIEVLPKKLDKRRKVSTMENKKLKNYAISDNMIL